MRYNESDSPFIVEQNSVKVTLEILRWALYADDRGRFRSEFISYEAIVRAIVLKRPWDLFVAHDRPGL